MNEEIKPGAILSPTKDFYEVIRNNKERLLILATDVLDATHISLSCTHLNDIIKVRKAFHCVQGAVFVEVKDE